MNKFEVKLSAMRPKSSVRFSASYSVFIFYNAIVNLPSNLSSSSFFIMKCSFTICSCFSFSSRFKIFFLLSVKTTFIDFYIRI